MQDAAHWLEALRGLDIDRPVRIMNVCGGAMSDPSPWQGYAPLYPIISSSFPARDVRSVSALKKMFTKPFR